MNKIRLYIPPLILGFVIVPLLVYWRWLRWLLVLSRWVLWEKYCSLSRSCSGVFHFWNSNLGYWLNMHFFSVPCVALVGNFLAELNLNWKADSIVGWYLHQFISGCSCGISFSMSRQRKLLCWKICAISFWPLSGYPWIFSIWVSAVDWLYRSDKRPAWFCIGILLPVA